MAQHDFNIADQTAASALSDINNALRALATLSSGASEPATTYPNQPWYDATANIMKMRTEADDGWINLFYLDQAANAIRVLDGTQVSNPAGTQTGKIGSQTQAVWNAGTAALLSLISPAQLKAAVEVLAPQGIGGEVDAGTSTKYFDDTVYFDETVFDGNLLASGSVRVSFDVSRGGFTPGNTVEILLDGVVVYSNVYATVGYVSDTVDVTFSKYQKLKVTTSGGNGFKNFALSTGGGDLVAVTLSGMGDWS